ncbi:MAG: arsenite methyltransferase [Candidatus Promineifilaceae bacterium]|nr:arsenite methyltransferase [Candidatus Promineifilaceae bacterium]
MSDKEAVYQAVRTRYSALAEAGGESSEAELCCSPLDDYTVDLASIPVNAGQLALGCGDPILLAELNPGETVLDLGSGAGIDCFLAAERVGTQGRVIGVDMTAAMLAQAEKNRQEAGLENVSFRQGQIEALPLDDATVDVVISNCVINLSPDKEAVLAEAFRVLRPGGRLAVADMVTLGRLSPAAQADLEAWTCCVSGAAAVRDLVAILRQVGFVAVSVRDKSAPDLELADGPAHTAEPRLFSARIRASKPA